jgi:hypothetical protein
MLHAMPCVFCLFCGTGLKSVTCSAAQPGAILPGDFKVNATLTSGAPGCTTSTSYVTTVTAECCLMRAESSYAMGNVSGSAFSTATCFSTSLPACGNSNWGWSNKLSGETPPDSSPAYPIIAGGGKDCKGRTSVGDVQIACVNTGTTSTVTFGLNQHTIGTAPSNHVYLGCMPNNACTPPAFYLTKLSACGASATVARCGGNIGTIPVSAKLNCTCDSVHWVFHQSASSFTVQRSAEGGCIL